jgi:hypothetical protein
LNDRPTRNWSIHCARASWRARGWTSSALFADNLDRFLSGCPLANRFEPERGY